jgi:DNA-binding transcriptional MerR regulator
MTMGAKDSFTIDELALAAGMTPRNVRAYRTKGLLSPPIRVGRTSRYRTAHLHRLRDIRQLRDAGLPLKLIIEAAHRGEDLGPGGVLWLAAGRMRGRQLGAAATAAAQLPSFVVDPQAYALMQTLTGRGLAPSTVMLLALQVARAGTALAADLIKLLAADPETSAAQQLPIPAKTAVIDLATVITREMLGHTLAVPTSGA